MVVTARPLRDDFECYRWYADGGEACLVLSVRGRLLEPFPTFGPVTYRVLALRATFSEADEYALCHGFAHLRERQALRKGMGGDDVRTSRRREDPGRRRGRARFAMATGVMKPIIELLTFAGCPNAEPTFRLVERVVDELDVEVEMRRVEVVNAQAAVENRFLGSPTVRVNGRDVEPGVEERTDFAWSCRVYRTTAGIRGRPDRRWIRAALLSAE